MHYPHRRLDMTHKFSRVMPNANANANAPAKVDSDIEINARTCRNVN